MDLMNHQQKFADLMADPIEKMADSSSRCIPLSALSGFEDAGSSASSVQKNPAGTLKMVSMGNSEMARGLGVNPGIKLAFTGDTENIDMSKLKKNMHSGKHRKKRWDHGSPTRLATQCCFQSFRPSGTQPAQKFEGNMKGIPCKYMKAKNICCGFNMGSYQKQCGHLIGKVKVFHWC